MGKHLTLARAVLVAAGAGVVAGLVATPAVPAAADGPRSAAVGRPFAADPFNGAIPGDVSDGKGELPPANNPPGASPVMMNALPGANITQTRFGSIDDTDRLFLIAVRWAGLWERPSCLRAQTQAQSPRVKEICQILASDHTALDEEGRFVARQLNIGLPDQPNPDQQAWMREFWNLQGHEFDVTAVHWMRFAHGSVFKAIATVRASTRNELVRLLSERANNMVNKHMSLLESTGLVNHEAQPRAAIGVPAAALANAQIPTLDRQQGRTADDIKRAWAPKNQTFLNPTIIAIVVVSVLVAGASIRRVVNGR
jgi:hypothetical protein